MSATPEPCTTCDHGRAYHIARTGGCIDLVTSLGREIECPCPAYAAPGAADTVTLVMTEQVRDAAVAHLERIASRFSLAALACRDLGVPGAQTLALRDRDAVTLLASLLKDARA